jgi:niacin transporter
MSAQNESIISVAKPTLTFSGLRALVFQLILISATVILPVVAHLSGAPVRLLLPMHWPVILAGLIYGWRSGLLTGILAPIVSYLLSGFPLPNILPSMTMELLTYGLVAGILREVLRFNPFLSVAIALIIGRIVFIVSVLFGNSTGITSYPEYFQAALLPGVIAGLFQIALLPLLAKWWMNREQRAIK